MMIPWIREKFTERRARWIAIRSRPRENGSKKTDSTDSSGSIQCTSSSSGSADTKKNRLNHFDKSDSEDDTFGPSASVTDVNLRIVNPVGDVYQLKFSPNANGREIRERTMDIFVYSLFSQNGFLPFGLEKDQFKLIRSRIQCIFDDHQTLAAGHVQNNDEFLLVWSYPKQLYAKTVILRGPKQRDINRVTSNHFNTIEKSTIPVVNINELVLQSDIQYDIRQIVISLAQASAYIIGIGPYAKRLIEMFRHKLIEKHRREIDNLQNLIEMGFEKMAVQQALRINNDVYALALDWLIENQNKTNSNHQSSSSSSASATIANFITKTSTKNIETPNDNVQLLLEIIRIYCNEYVRPSTEMLQRIKAMGFNEAKIQAALNVTRNNYTEACEWLLAENVEQATAIEANSTDNGLPIDSPILKVLLASPHIQLSLSNPKTFIAYLSILENYNSMNMYLGDGETAGIIGQILRTYHEEKHILAINQFSSAANTE